VPPALLHALTFVNVFSAALVAGGQICVLLVIVPIKRRWPVRPSVELHLAMLGHQIDRYMKPSGILSGLTALAILALLPVRPPAVVGAMALGLLGTLGVVITSRFFNVRANRSMESWNLDALPADYDAFRDRWDRVHAIRTGCGALGLAGYLVGAMLR
jgi:hypothetical protein